MKKKKFYLHKPKNDNLGQYSIKYGGTVVCHIPDYMNSKCTDIMIKALNKGIKKLPLSW